MIDFRNEGLIAAFSNAELGFRAIVYAKGEKFAVAIEDESGEQIAPRLFKSCAEAYEYAKVCAS